MEKKNLDWANLGFGYVQTEKRYVSVYKDGKWDNGTLTEDATVTLNECAGVFQYAQTVGLTEAPSFPSQCIGCGKCEMHCPQGIPIREKLKEADRALLPKPFKLGINIARKYMFRKK